MKLRRIFQSAGVAISVVLMAGSAKADISAEDIIQQLGAPELEAFSAHINLDDDGATWIEWQTRAGCIDQLEYSQDLVNWAKVAEGTYRYGQSTRVKILDAPTPNTGSGSSGGGTALEESIGINLSVSAFTHGQTLISFHTEYGPYRVLLDLDFSDIIARPIYAKRFDRDAPLKDVRMVLSFHGEAWDPSMAVDLVRSAWGTTPEIDEIIDGFIEFSPQVHAELLIDQSQSNQTETGDYSNTFNVTNRSYLRVVRKNADADGDGIADALEFDSLLGIGYLGDFDLTFTPFNTGADGVPDLLVALAAVQSATGGGTGTGTGGEGNTPSPYEPPSFAILPLEEEFRPTSSNQVFEKAWVTDKGTVAAVKSGDGKTRHMVWKKGNVTHLWDNEDYGTPEPTPEEGYYPRAEIMDVNRAGEFLLKVQREVTEDGEKIVVVEWHVVDEENVASMSGTQIKADVLKDSDVKSLDYYSIIEDAAEAIAQQNDGTIKPWDEIHKTLSVHPEISEFGNVVGGVSVLFGWDFVPNDPENSGTTGSAVVLPFGDTPLPFFWKLGSIALGDSGLINEYFQENSESGFFDTTGEPNFNYIFFGGVETMAFSSDEGGGDNIALVSTLSTPPISGLANGFIPEDGNLWGNTVSAAGSNLQQRSLIDVYDDTGFQSNGGQAIVNNKSWNIASISRPGDSENDIPEINGPAFCIRAFDDAGSVSWQAWGMEQLCEGFSGDAPSWASGTLLPMQMSNKGVMVATATQAGGGGIPELSLLLPVEIEIRRKGDATSDESVLVRTDDTLEVGLSESYLDEVKQFEDSISWQYRQLNGDGSYEEWVDFGAHGKGTKFEHNITVGGIYQVKAVFEGGCEVTYDRDASEVLEEGQMKTTIGPGLVGEADSLGVCDEQVQIDLCRKAQELFGSRKYDSQYDLPAEFGFADFPSDGNGVMRCNIFVAHVAVDAGLIVEDINGIFNSYPPLANEWANAEGTKYNPIVFDPITDVAIIPHWKLLNISEKPQPGWIIGHPQVDDAGHVGIIDYDGNGMGAGSSGTVNKNYDEFFDGSSRYRKYTSERFPDQP
jgi:hypothetical protein